MNSGKSKITDEARLQEQFITRWSRLKRAAHESLPEPENVADAVDASALATSADPQIDIQTLTDADMPPLESLDKDSDYRGFLSEKVSETLRKQALRKLFHSPEFNVRDGLDDYDEEYTHFAKLGDIVTADMRHQLETEAKRLREFAENESEIQTQTTITSAVDIPGLDVQREAEQPTSLTEQQTLASQSDKTEVES